VARPSVGENENPKRNRHTDPRTILDSSYSPDAET
jgi:hypothetical protein